MEQAYLRSSCTRRDFIKQTAAAGCLLGLCGSVPAAIAAPATGEMEEADLVYRHAIMSTMRLKEMQHDYDQLLAGGKLSDNETFRKYIKNRRFAPPEEFPEATSIILLATPAPPMVARFHHRGSFRDLMIPPQYSDDGIAAETLVRVIERDIIGREGARLVRGSKIFIKPLAVRSGLGFYGRNNIVYVEGMGSYITLHAFFTDYVPDSYGWYGMEMLDYCYSCRLCLQHCPNACITEDNFVIDAGRCLTLYNEVAGEFPEWIDPGAHNALIGCMRCQLECPGNREVADITGRLEDVTEEETARILEGDGDERLYEILCRKLGNFYLASSDEYFPNFSRNLRVLMA